MSDVEVKKFYEIAKADPQIMRRLIEGEPPPDELVERAIAEASLLGISFTPAEGSAWLDARKPTDKDELSDQQLETVAGGKGANYDSYTQDHMPSYFHHTSGRRR